MTEEKGKTGEGRTLHLEVVDAQTVILECFNLLIKFRVGKGLVNTHMMAEPRMTTAKMTNINKFAVICVPVAHV